MSGIVDFHVHISTVPSSIHLHPDYSITKVLSDQARNHIDKSICFINPFVSKLLCPHNPRHKIRIVDSQTPGSIRLFCNDCNKVYFHGVDPIREFNITFMNQVKNEPSIIPFIYLNVCPSNINEEIEFYEHLFPGRIAGYKMHPTLSGRSVSEIHLEATTKPVLIHTGVEACATPKSGLAFAEQYTGTVILAHLARFNEEVLMKLGQKENLFVDTSPMTFLYDLVLKKPHRIYDTSWISDSVVSIDVFYQRLFSKIDYRKVIFASDAPFSDCSKEINHFSNMSHDFIRQCNLTAKKILLENHGA